MSIRDTRLAARALEQRWPVPDDVRAGLVRQMMAIVADRSCSPRERTSAFKAILAAEAQNQADQHKAIDVSVSTRHDRLDAIAADLGIEVGLIEAASREADSRTGTTQEPARERTDGT
jgi:hypothetical protein